MLCYFVLFYIWYFACLVLLYCLLFCGFADFAWLAALLGCCLVLYIFGVLLFDVARFGCLLVLLFVLLWFCGWLICCGFGFGFVMRFVLFECCDCCVVALCWSAWCCGLICYLAVLVLLFCGFTWVLGVVCGWAV